MDRTECLNCELELASCLSLKNSPLNVKLLNRKTEQEPLELSIFGTKPPGKEDDTYDCSIGEMPVKMKVDPSCPVNVMSREQFRKLRKDFKFFAPQNIPLIIGNYKFIAMFSAFLKFKEISRMIIIHVEEGAESVLKINAELGEKLNLINSVVVASPRVN